MYNYQIDTELFHSRIGIASTILYVTGNKSFNKYLRDFVKFDEVENKTRIIAPQNPSKFYIDKCLFELEGKNPNLIIAVGGGSVMDTAKLLRYYAFNDAELICVPTTAGSGAESTRFAVMYEEGVKKSIEDDLILPDEFVLTGRVLDYIPLKQLRISGCDAVCHLIESLWSKESEKLGFGASYVIYERVARIINLLSESQLGDYDKYMLLSFANYGGQCINITHTTGPHALSYTLTSRYGIPHGQAVINLLPYFIEYNSLHDEQVEDKMTALALEFGLPYGELVEFIRRKIDQFGLRIDFTPEMIKSMKSEVNEQRMKNNPVPLTEVFFELFT